MREPNERPPSTRVSLKQSNGMLAPGLRTSLSTPGEHFGEAARPHSRKKTSQRCLRYAPCRQAFSVADGKSRSVAARCSSSAIRPSATFPAGRKAPSGPQWLHEIKLDGYRMAARIDNGPSATLRKGPFTSSRTIRDHRRHAAARVGVRSFTAGA
jgi:hypothetical protein